MLFSLGELTAIVQDLFGDTAEGDMTEEQCEEVWRQGVAQTSVRCLLPAGHAGPHEYPFAWPPKGRKR